MTLRAQLSAVRPDSVWTWTGIYPTPTFLSSETPDSSDKSVYGRVIDCVFFFSLSACLCVYDQESSQGFIRVQAPQFSKVSMAVQLTEELQAADVLTRFLSQERYVLYLRLRYSVSLGYIRPALAVTSRSFFLCPLSSVTVKREELSLYEIGGNISKSCRY